MLTSVLWFLFTIFLFCYPMRIIPLEPFLSSAKFISMIAGHVWSVKLHPTAVATPTYRKKKTVSTLLVTPIIVRKFSLTITIFANPITTWYPIKTLDLFICFHIPSSNVVFAFSNYNFDKELGILSESYFS